MVAAQTKEIANQTQSIALTIVTDADEKEFEGKHNVKAKKHNVEVEKKQTVVSKPEIKKSEAKIEQKHEVKKTITSNVKDDEWESF